MRGWLVAGVLALAACGSERTQHEVTAPGELLTAEGRLREPGWARRELLRWDPSRVHVPARLRAWDFFTVQSDRAAVNLTLFDLGFIQLASVSVVDYASGARLEARNLGGVLALSPGLDGVATYRADAASPVQLGFDSSGGTTTVSIDMPPLFGPPARGSFTIRRRPEMPFLSLATPFADAPTDFFYEQKIPGMSAEGSVTVADQSFTFPAGSIAIMDWGRGQWPEQATWRWAGGAGTVEGKALAFNLGEGFGDDSHATENLVVYDDVAYKLGVVRWTHDATDPLREWTLRATDGRLALVLHPVAPETGGIDLGDKYSRLKKAYGTYTGTIQVGDRTLAISGLAGFAEEMQLSW